MLFRSNDTATTEIYTLSLHDALPIWRCMLLVCRPDSKKAMPEPTPFLSCSHRCICALIRFLLFRPYYLCSLPLGVAVILPPCPYQSVFCLLQCLWLVDIVVLIKRHYKTFARFTKTMDKINEINTVKEE